MDSPRSLVYNSLAVQLEAGVDLPASLRTAASGARGKLRQHMEEVAGRCAEGSTIADAMREHPETFAPFDVMLVQVAEISGTLAESFGALAHYYDFRLRISRTIRAGMVLPIGLLLVASTVSPLPQFVPGNITLWQYLLRVAGILSIFAVPAGLIAAVARFTPKTGPLRLILDRVSLTIPLWGRAVRNLAMARFCRTFNMLYRCGSLGMDECVEGAADMAGNEVIRRMLSPGAESARQGQPASEQFSDRLSPEFVVGWQTGENAGKLEETTLRLADDFTYKTEQAFGRVAVCLPIAVYALVSVLIIILIIKGFLAYFDQINELIN